MECPNCGNTLSASEKECKYCGTTNSEYGPISNSIKNTINSVLQPSPKPAPANSSNNRYNSDGNRVVKIPEKSNNTSINWVVAILLVFIFWPVGVIYIVYKLFK